MNAEQDDSAVGMRDGPLETGAMSHFHRAHAVRADLARRAGSLDEARDSYRRAIELVRQEPERRYLEGCLARILE